MTISVSDIPVLLKLEPSLVSRTERTHRLVDTILRRRSDFGITRVGAITRLDRIGIPVVQVVRPQALSNSVTQGKGFSLLEAAASALMEALETWAGERLKPSFFAHMKEVESSAYFGAITSTLGESGDRILPWIDAWDLVRNVVVSAPMALVDTDYTISSPFPHDLYRSTTGLGGGSTVREAFIHAALEILERDAVARAQEIPGFFDDFQVDISSVRAGQAKEIIGKIIEADLIAGAWLIPTDHNIPTYWCHVMSRESDLDLAPLPASGFGCDLTHDGALAKALLEACQARLSAISGAREDITRLYYIGRYDREALSSWRRQLTSPLRARMLPYDSGNASHEPTLERVLGALHRAGASVTMVVPLFVDLAEGINIVRVLAPPLRPEGSHA